MYRGGPSDGHPLESLVMIPPKDFVTMPVPPQEHSTLTFFLQLIMLLLSFLIYVCMFFILILFCKSIIFSSFIFCQTILTWFGLIFWSFLAILTIIRLIYLLYTFLCIPHTKTPIDWLSEPWFSCFGWLSFFWMEDFLFMIHQTKNLLYHLQLLRNLLWKNLHIRLRR